MWEGGAGGAASSGDEWRLGRNEYVGRLSLRPNPPPLLLLPHRPFPEALFGDASLDHPLLGTRQEGAAIAALGESADSLPPLERLLRCESEGAGAAIAEALWEAVSDGDAEAALLRLATGDALLGWEEEIRAGGDGRREDSQAEG